MIFNLKCAKCGSNISLSFGRYGLYYSCSNKPNHIALSLNSAKNITCVLKNNASIYKPTNYFDYEKFVITIGEIDDNEVEAYIEKKKQEAQ